MYPQCKPLQANESLNRLTLVLSALLLEQKHYNNLPCMMHIFFNVKQLLSVSVGEGKGVA